MYSALSSDASLTLGLCMASITVVRAVTMVRKGLVNALNSFPSATVRRLQFGYTLLHRYVAWASQRGTIPIRPPIPL